MGNIKDLLNGEPFTARIADFLWDGLFFAFLANVFIPVQMGL